MNTATVSCVFRGGTLHAKRQQRLMFGFLPLTIMEPVYEHDGKGNANRKDITHRQIYVRAQKLDHDGHLGYDLREVELSR